MAPASGLAAIFPQFYAILGPIARLASRLRYNRTHCVRECACRDAETPFRSLTHHLPEVTAYEPFDHRSDAHSSHGPRRHGLLAAWSLQSSSSPAAAARSCSVRSTVDARADSDSAESRAGHAAQCFVRSDARAVRRIQQGIRQALAGRDGPGGHDRAIARRCRHAGPRGDRRLKADVLTLAIAYDMDQIAEITEPVSEGLAEAVAAQQLPLHVDDRVPGSQGQSEGNQGLERPGEGRRRGDHAESEDLGRRSLQLPGRVGLRPEAQQQRSGEGQGIRDRAVQERAGARLRRPRLDDDVRAARNRRRAAGLGKRSAAGAQGTWAKTSSRWSCRR